MLDGDKFSGERCQGRHIDNTGYGENSLLNWLIGRSPGGDLLAIT
jgi:hypothetical protein